MGLPQNETNLLSPLGSPAKRSIFSVHKVKWHFPSLCPWRHVKYLRRCRPTPVSQVCVEQDERPQKSGSKHWGVRIWSLSTPSLHRRDSSFWKKKKGGGVSPGRAKEILDLKHGCFVFTWTRSVLQTDGEWKNLIMRGRFPSELGSAEFAGAGGHKTKCRISEINFERSYTLKNNLPVWLVEGKCVSLSIADICALPILV